MTDNELHEYWMPARRWVTKSDDFQASKDLAKILGIPYPFLSFWKVMELTDELKLQLRLLAGPHAKTVAKIINIRKTNATQESEGHVV